MNDIEYVLDQINLGRAILFTGADFSKDCENVLNEKLPLPRELAKKICKLGNFEEDNDVTFATDYYINQGGNIEKNKNILISYIRKLYTVVRVSRAVSMIASAPWNQFYTTNYDDALENAISDITPITCDLETKKYEIKDRRCVHINGYIRNLTEKTFETSFKLSDKSGYDGFFSSSWYTVLKRDFALSRILVFVGYSLIDIDIKRIVFDAESLKEKIFFITRKDFSAKEDFYFSKYGHVIPIGIDTFAEKVSSYIFSSQKNTVKYIKQYTPCKEQVYPGDKLIEDFLIFGRLEKSSFEECMLRSDNTRYAVIREKLDDVRKLLKIGNVIVISESGNGKTVFMHECLPILSRDFKEIYLFDDPYINYIDDFRIISKNTDSPILIVIDNYTSYVDLFQYPSNFRPSNIRFLMTARIYSHLKNKDQLDKYGLIYSEIQIDILTDAEIKNFFNLVNQITCLGTKESDALMRLKKNCRNQLSLILSALLDSQNIREKIREIVAPLL